MCVCLCVYEIAHVDDIQVLIPDSLTELIHKLADNMHQNWAKNKIKKGFRYGPVRERERELRGAVILLAFFVSPTSSFSTYTVGSQ